MTWTELAVPGLLLLGGATVVDQRGAFTKVLSGDDEVLGSFKGTQATGWEIFPGEPGVRG